MTEDNINEISGLFCIKGAAYAGSRDSMLLERCTMSCQLAVRKMGYQRAEVARFLGVTTSAVVRVANFEDLPEIEKYL